MKKRIARWLIWALGFASIATLIACEPEPSGMYGCPPSRAGGGGVATESNLPRLLSIFCATTGYC